MCGNGLCMVSYVRYTTKIAKENRTLGKSGLPRKKRGGFSEYAQNQATRQPACPPVPVRTGMTCRAGTTLSGWLYTVLAVVISLLSLFANLSTGSSTSFSHFTFYCHGISSSVVTRKWTRPRFVGQAGFTSLPVVDRVIAR